jgi:hypothetical protein
MSYHLLYRYKIKDLWSEGDQIFIIFSDHNIRNKIIIDDDIYKYFQYRNGIFEHNGEEYIYIGVIYCFEGVVNCYAARK